MTRSANKQDRADIIGYALRELVAFAAAMTVEEVWIEGSAVCWGRQADGARFRATLSLNPELGPGEISLISDERGARVEGGSPAAVLHAVYEWLERLGVLFEASGERTPPPVARLDPPMLRVRHSPSVEERGIRMHLNFVQDQSFFSEDGFAAFVDRTARLKLNSLIYHMYTPQQWFPFEYRGVRHLDLSLGNLDRKPIDPGMIGRDRVKVKEHWFPREFEDIRDPEALLAAVHGRLARMMARAGARGIRNTLSFEPESVPPGVLDALSANGGAGDGAGLALPEDWQTGWSGQRLGALDARDPLLLDITAERCLQAAAAFPDLNELQLISREGTAWHPGPGESYESEIARLSERFGLDESLFDLKALGRIVPPNEGPEMNPKAHPYWTVLPGNDYYPTVVGSLRFVELALDALADSRVRAMLAEREMTASIAVYSPNPETVRLMMPAIAAMLPAGTRFHCLADYSAGDIANSLPDWRPLADAGHRVGVFSWLEFDGIMMLAQNWTSSLRDNVRAAMRLGARSMSFNHWRVRSLEANFAAAASLCWNADEEGRERRYAASRYGAGQAEQAIRAYALLEEASAYAKRRNYNIGFTSDWVIVHSTGEPGYSWRVLEGSARRYAAAAAAFSELADACRASADGWLGGAEQAAYLADLCAMSEWHVRAVGRLQNAKLPLIGYKAWPIGNPHAAWPAPGLLAGLLAEAEAALELERRYMDVYAPWVSTCDEQGQLVMHHQGVIEPLEAFAAELRARLAEETAWREEDGA
ncbi:hypothetical protein [Cohnella sp. GCM10027633]|uniref:hypothetical protein n=1 Tax=unclassified Cohnella TaxID=2636738 RepID=UPI00364397D9